MREGSGQRETIKRQCRRGEPPTMTLEYSFRVSQTGLGASCQHGSNSETTQWYNRTHAMMYLSANAVNF